VGLRRWGERLAKPFWSLFWKLWKCGLCRIDARFNRLAKVISRLVCTVVTVKCGKVVHHSLMHWLALAHQTAVLSVPSTQSTSAFFKIAYGPDVPANSEFPSQHQTDINIIIFFSSFFTHNKHIPIVDNA
jgi:hypothetical protein